jgi:glycine/D-amino acid oxidase-like deaminating enzyme
MNEIFPEAPASLWLDTSPPQPAEPALQGDIHADVAIIGGGFTGLVTALEVKRAEPSLRIALLEAKTCGYGASGRNGSFAMTVVGLGAATNALVYGKHYVKDAHTYMERAVEAIDELILREELDCDRTRPGFLRVATTPRYVRRLQHEIEMMGSLGFSGIDWIEAAEVRDRIHSERYLGALWEPRLVLMDPLKLIKEERRLVKEAGVQVYENTPVVQVTDRPQFTLKTPAGSVRCEKVVFATNAYSHLFPALRRAQMPGFTYMIATEPLSDQQLAQIGWSGGEGVEDARNLIHYYRLTTGNRLVMGGGPVGLTYGFDLHGDRDESAWRHLEDHLRFLFPALKGVKITHRWGGPISLTLQLMPSLGYLGDRRAVYSLGYIGHGVSMSHLNAKTLRDLLLERQSDLLEAPFVNRRTVPWPPEPLRYGLAATMRGYLQVEDWFNERGMAA